jgi:hypothetical protein
MYEYFLNRIVLLLPRAIKIISFAEYKAATKVKTWYMICCMQYN